MSWAEDNGIDIGDADDFDYGVDNEDEWVTRDGKVIKIAEMTNKHLYNAYKLKSDDRLQREMILRLFRRNFGEVV